VAHRLILQARWPTCACSPGLSTPKKSPKSTPPRDAARVALLACPAVPFERESPMIPGVPAHLTGSAGNRAHCWTSQQCHPSADSWFLRHAKPGRWRALSVSEGRGLPRTPLPTPIAPLCACHAVRATRPVQGVPIVPRIPKTWGAEQGIRIDAVAWTSQDAVVGVRS